MTNPIYQFEKGVGWTIATSKIYTLRCGTKVRLEERKPNAGEPYYRDDIMYNPELDFQKHASMFKLTEWSLFQANYTFSKSYKYYTLVPV